MDLKACLLGIEEPFISRDGRFLFFNSGEKENHKDLHYLEGIPERRIMFFKQKIHGNMGVEVSIDGSYLFFSRATWGSKGFKIGRIIGSDILF